MTRKTGPEAVIQIKVEAMLRKYGWFTVTIIGNIFQMGLPDLYCTHSRYGARWIEIKNPKNYRFTAAQLDMFPKLCANGAGVWVLTDDTDWEYQKLFRAYNYHEFLN